MGFPNIKLSVGLQGEKGGEGGTWKWSLMFYEC